MARKTHHAKLEKFLILRKRNAWNDCAWLFDYEKFYLWFVVMKIINNLVNPALKTDNSNAFPTFACMMKYLMQNTQRITQRITQRKTSSSERSFTHTSIIPFVLSIVQTTAFYVAWCVLRAKVSAYLVTQYASRKIRKISNFALRKA